MGRIARLVMEWGGGGVNQIALGVQVAMARWQGGLWQEETRWQGEDQTV